MGSPKLNRRRDWISRFLFYFGGRSRSFWWGLGLASTVALSGLVFAYIDADSVYQYQDSMDGATLPEVDAIVCLAGGRGRIAAAGDVWYRYWEQSENGKHFKPPVLYLSGMGHRSTWNSLTYQVRRGVFEVLSPPYVVMETESSNTDENARWLARHVAERGWGRILLITSSYHMKRARFIFQRVLSQLPHPVRIETLSYYQEPFDRDEWRGGIHGIRITMTEYLKLLWYRTFWEPDQIPLTELPREGTEQFRDGQTPKVNTESM